LKRQNERNGHLLKGLNINLIFSEKKVVLRTDAMGINESTELLCGSQR
jgi:hypothetical protein